LPINYGKPTRELGYGVRIPGARSAGAFYGESTIPAERLNELVMREMIRDMADALATQI
jgi:hypothetical protein